MKGRAKLGGFVEKEREILCSLAADWVKPPPRHLQRDETLAPRPMSHSASFRPYIYYYFLGHGREKCKGQFEQPY